VLGCFSSYSYETIGAYYYAHLLVNISPTALPEILEHDRYGLGNEIDALFSAVDPILQSNRTRSHDWPKYPSVVYLPLDPSLYNNSPSYGDSARQVAQHLHPELARKGRIVPHFLIDTILFPPLITSGPESQIVAVGLSGKPKNISASDQKAFCIQQTVLDAVNYMACYQILRDMNNRLENLPFVKQQLSSYVNQIQGRSSKSSRKIWERQRRNATAISLMDAYQYEFLNDRVQSSLARDAATLTRSSVSDEFEKNLVAKADQWELSYTIDTVKVESHLPKRDIIDELTREFSVQSSALLRREDLIKSRETALADFFRDLAVIDSTRANLKLQRSVWRLTIVATVLVVAGLGIELLTDNRKSIIWNAIINWLRRLWN
jgi:hypothetical protein